jgi:hypothetical protein
MQFIDSNLENVLSYLDRLTASSTPQWGVMNAQQMVEHITHTIEIAMGRHTYPVLVKEEDFPKMKAFILSDKPLPRNFKVDFVKDNQPLKYEELELAIDAYCDTWLDFEIWFSENDGKETMHPNFGPLNFDLWKRLHEKHLTHHLTQFGLIKED